MDIKSGSSAGARDRDDVFDIWRRVSTVFLLIEEKLFRIVWELSDELRRKNALETFIIVD